MDSKISPAVTADPGMKHGAYLKKTLFLVCMYMEEADWLVHHETHWQLVTNSVEKVNEILAGNIIHNHDLLVRVDAGCPDCLEEGKINIFLLFTLEQVNTGIWGIAPMPSTCNGDHLCNTTG